MKDVIEILKGDLQRNTQLAREHEYQIKECEARIKDEKRSLVKIFKSIDLIETALNRVEGN